MAALELGGVKASTPLDSRYSLTCVALPAKCAAFGEINPTAYSRQRVRVALNHWPTTADEASLPHLRRKPGQRRPMLIPRLPCEQVAAGGRRGIRHSAPGTPIGALVHG